MNLIQIIVDFFQYKIVGSIIVLTCASHSDRVRLTKDLLHYGLLARTCCDPNCLKNIKYNLQGVLYIGGQSPDLLNNVDKNYIVSPYKWLIIGSGQPNGLENAAYNSDITFIDLKQVNSSFANSYNNKDIVSTWHKFNDDVIHLEDVYVHPRDGVSFHPWAYWTASTGLIILHDRERILRRRNLKKYSLKIASPVGGYSPDWYNGTYEQYMFDEYLGTLDSGIRVTYRACLLLVDALNATVGFTYLSERQSSSNMYVEPFSTGVWLSCLGIGFVLAIVQRITSKDQVEKEGAFVATLATWLLQDASAVPQGLSGRWTFTVLSVCSMLVHAYYSSAIVSALMSTGRGGPDSLRSLADSRYAIASEDYDYIRHMMFNVKTNWSDLEYLKTKKLTPNFYQTIEKGVKLIEQGNTAFHTEYNQIYPHFKTFNDDSICKLQHVDTVPEVMSWVTTTRRGQWTDVLRSTSNWLHEVGLPKRILKQLRAVKPPCRASLLAERVKSGDVASLLTVTVFGAILSFFILGVEILFDKWKKMKSQIKEKDNSFNAGRKSRNSNWSRNSSHSLQT